MNKPAYLKPADLVKAIDSIAKRGAKLAADIQVAALSSIAHRGECGDPVYINRLYLSMPAGTRRASLAQWFVNHGAVRINDDKATKADMPFLTVKGEKPNMEAAHEQPWHEAKKDPGLDGVYDIRAALAAILKKAKKDGVKVNDPALLRGLNTLVSDTPTPAKAAA